MSKFIILISIIGILALAGIYYFKESFEVSPEDILTREDCLKRNGLWGRQGLSPKESCNLPSSDAGKICTSSDQCQGSCIGESVAATSGKCSDYQRVFGCHPFVEDGKAEGILCID